MHNATQQLSEFRAPDLCEIVQCAAHYSDRQTYRGIGKALLGLTDLGGYAYYQHRSIIGISAMIQS